VLHGWGLGQVFEKDLQKRQVAVLRLVGSGVWQGAEPK